MQVLKFDSAGNAESAYPLVKDEGGASIGGSIEDAETESGEGEIDDHDGLNGLIPLRDEILFPVLDDQ